MSGAVALVLMGAIPPQVSAPQATSPQASLVFDGVAVVDVEQGKLIPDQRVIVTGNRIQAVGPTGELRVPAGAHVVDARGKYLIPGLWDMHAHPDPAADFDVFHSLFIANGVTGIRIPYLATASLEDQIQWRKAVMDGTRVGPRQLLAGRTLNTFARSWGRDPDAVDRGMDSLRAMGIDYFKIYPLTTSSFYLAAAARRLGIPFGGHVAGISAIEASDSGIHMIDHLSSAGDLNKQCYVRTGSVERCQEVTEVFKRNGTALVPTLSIHARHNIRPDLFQASLPIYKRFTALASQFWADSQPFRGNWLHALSGDSEPLADTVGILRIAQEVGLPLLAGTDTGPGEVRVMPPGFSLHMELAMSVAEGLTPLNALQSATITVAKILRAADSLGTVATGKIADLVLLDANPLDDITNTTTVRAVVANGRFFDRAALDSLIAEVQAKGP